MRFKKCGLNPILKPNPEVGWESLCVLNPAVVYKDDEKLFYMIYRAAGQDATHYMNLGLATSKDGINFKRESPLPVLAPDKNGADGGGTEDPRLIQMGDWYYLTYASRVFAPGQYWLKDHKDFGFHPPLGPHNLFGNDTATHLAVSKDLRNWKKLGRITNAKDDDRDVVIFPDKIGDYFYRTSRPTLQTRLGKSSSAHPSIYLTKSNDLLEWDEPYVLLYEGKEDWESLKVGASCPPIKTNKGWLLIYHGVSEKDHAYRVGALLLDLNDPVKILAKTTHPLMEPEYEYETAGFYNGCVFPTANIVKDETLLIYYGAADHYIGLASCAFEPFLNDLAEGKL